MNGWRRFALQERDGDFPDEAHSSNPLATSYDREVFVGAGLNPLLHRNLRGLPAFHGVLNV